MPANLWRERLLGQRLDEAGQLPSWVSRQLQGLGLRVTTALLWARPLRGLRGQPAFRSWNVTSREQTQLSAFSLLTFNVIIRAHLPLSEVTEEKPD